VHRRRPQTGSPLAVNNLWLRMAQGLVQGFVTVVPGRPHKSCDVSY
jgi:hypothetical protein